jgi:cell division protein FtsL
MSRGRRARLRVVRPRGPRRVPFLIACFVLVGSLVLGVVTVQALASQGSFRMQALSQRNAQLVELNGRMQLEIAELSAPSRIQREAKRLGFRVPAPDEVHTIVVKEQP